MLPIFLPIAVSIVAGESIAGEASAGTLRYLLARPVDVLDSSWRSSCPSGSSFSSPCSQSRSTALVVGLNLLDSGGSVLATTTVSGTPLTPQQLAIRTVLTIIYIGWSMLGVASVAFFLSTLTDSPSRPRLVG